MIRSVGFFVRTTNHMRGVNWRKIPISLIDLGAVVLGFAHGSERGDLTSGRYLVRNRSRGLLCL